MIIEVDMMPMVRMLPLHMMLMVVDTDMGIPMVVIISFYLNSFHVYEANF